MYWAQFIHIYQPPTQKEVWIKRITHESYRKIFKGLLAIPRAKITVNINGVLCEFLDRFGGQDVLDDIKLLLERGSLELTGSAYYHAFLPLLPESEIERQIILNERVLTRYFGPAWKKGGFFSPEMAYSKKIAKVAKRLGYTWIIIDELSFPHPPPRTERIYTIKNLDDFSVFFRERRTSFTILSAQAGSVSAVLRMLGDRTTANEYLVTAMDGETFGHHRPGLEKLLFNLLEEPLITPVLVSDLSALFRYREAVEPRNATWATTKQDIQEGVPYVRWHNAKNSIQQKQWQLTHLALSVVHAHASSAARRLLDRALHSDQYWWSSARPWWSLEMIERGAHELLRVVLISPRATQADRSKAKKLYQDIIFTGFEWQRSGLVDEIARQEDEEVRERMDEKERFVMTKEEYSEMIQRLQEQMHFSANSEEYYRAAMIKDRIAELREEMKKVSA